MNINMIMNVKMRMEVNININSSISRVRSACAPWTSRLFAYRGAYTPSILEHSHPANNAPGPDVSKRRVYGCVTTRSKNTCDDNAARGPKTSVRPQKTKFHPPGEARSKANLA